MRSSNSSIERLPTRQSLKSLQLRQHGAHSANQLHQPNRKINQTTDISELFFIEAGKLPELEQPFKAAFDVENMGGHRIL
jgi:hypothetical protein